MEYKSMEYSSISKTLTRQLSKEEKKNHGIYFTPPSCVKHNIDLLQPYLPQLKKVLEPSCGSGEYITALRQAAPHVRITGIEYNATIYPSIVPLQNAHVTLLNEDFLLYPATKYDLIIGNPPYYVMKKEAVPKEYHRYFEGRPNIFILFLLKALKLLEPNGLLSFVLPKNFLNCLYYDKTRAYISDHFQILHIVDCAAAKYLETQQDTIILILQQRAKVNNKAFILKPFHTAYTIFISEASISEASISEASISEASISEASISEASIGQASISAASTSQASIRDLYQNARSLWDLGFKVSVGTVVWNQCKDLLTDDASQTRLIYSSDIVENTLSPKKYSNAEKKNFITKAGLTRPMIVVNRGYGVGDYKFNYCLIDQQTPFLIENHLICIEAREDTLLRADLIGKYKKIIQSLTDKKTTEFIGLYFGNNAINTTELNHLLPIYA